MKAAVCYEFGQDLVIDELELSPPQQGEVKVKLAACAICHSDIHYAEGAWGGSVPILLGHEAAGVVEELGEGAVNLNVGDHVIVSLIRSCGRCPFCSVGQSVLCEQEFPLDKKSRLHTKDGTAVTQGIRTGAFAEYVVVDQSQLVAIPKDIPLNSAALLACGVITGLGAVTHTAKLEPGSSAVVIGTGGVGLNSIQGARIAGAQPIIAVDIVDAKLEAAKGFGATHTVNSKTENLRDAVFDYTYARGADYVFVTVGNAKAMEQGLELLKAGGTLVIVGMPASGVKIEVEAANFAHGAQRILGSKMGMVNQAADIPKLIALYQEKRLKLDELITAEYPLEDINEAIAKVKRGEALRNVIRF